MKKNSISRHRVLWLTALVLGASPLPLMAQEAQTTGDAPPPSAETPPAVAGAQSFTPADFTRFNPRNALDMLQNVPGFQIRVDRSGNGARGLGQANENVLVNGQRLTSKSDDLFSQLSRIPSSSVVRIDIVDGATLAIPGLSGQAANVITRPDAFSGQFKYHAEARAHYSHPGYVGAEVSAKGTLGKIEYTAALKNDTDRGAFGGPYVLRNADLTVRESRIGRLWSDNDSPQMTLGLSWKGGKSQIANLNGSYERRYGTYSEIEDRRPVSGIANTSNLMGRARGYGYELGGDYQQPLLGGTLKLIGLDRFNHDLFTDTSKVDYAANALPSEGDKYVQATDAGEVIGRGEFSWKWGKADWQLAFEGAFNRFDKDASLFGLTNGSFVEIPFPQGDGGVREARYEGSLSYGWPLSSKLSVQATLAAERSTISQTGPAGISRSFFRPKGSVSLAWAPGKGLDVSLKLARVVGQLRFGDFLGQVFLQQGNQNGSNFDLVPEQSWNADLSLKKDLKKWGSTNLRLFYRGVSDYIDLIPLATGGEARGNISSARRYGFEWNSTFTLDPIGFTGAKIDSNVILQASSLKDPLTGLPRHFSGIGSRNVEINLRHDVPHSNWAWGGGFEMHHQGPQYRRSEIALNNEGPFFDFYFIENKNVLGMTVKAEAINLFGATHDVDRTIFTGDRPNSPVAYIEDRHQTIGPIFRISLSGSF